MTKTVRATATTYGADDVIDVKELALRLKVSPQTVERMDLPTVYLGRLRRYVWGQIIEFLRERAR